MSKSYAVELMQIDPDGNCRVIAWNIDEDEYLRLARQLNHRAPDMDSIVPASNVEQMATQAVEGSVILKGNPYV